MAVGKSISQLGEERFPLAAQLLECFVLVHDDI
jgi:hypothetical protein